MLPTSMSELVFSYRTRRQRDVQLATFGRELDGSLDAVVGYELHYVTITCDQARRPGSTCSPVNVHRPSVPQKV